MDSEVPTALADAFPDHEVVETRPPGPSWHERNRAIEVEFDDGNEAGDLPPGFEDRLPVYEAVRLLGTSGLFERGPEFHDGPREDLAEWVDTEMQRRLDRL